MKISPNRQLFPRHSAWRRAKAGEDAEGLRQRGAVTDWIGGQPALFVPKTVLLEFEWVLRGVYGYGASVVAR